MGTCALCHNFRKRDVDDPRLASEITPQQFLDIGNLKQCNVCSVLVKGVLTYEDSTWTLAKDVSRVYLYALSNRGESLTLELYFREDRPKLVLEFYSTQDPGSGWEAIRQRTPVKGYPAIPNGINWATSIIQSCSANHKSCWISEQPTFPRRTIFFQRSSNGDIEVKLQKHQKEKGRYIALSHCWGSAPTCKTTSKNVNEYQQSIPWTLLSTTFRDSILFSLELDVHHLWIDALCIVQDDAKDWDVESSKMADVYENAFVTLAATTSSDGTGGCFSVNHKPIREFHLGSHIMVREKLSHWQIPPTKLSAQTYPLLSRGWVLQERYLSRRVLYFGEQEFVWECMEELVCECGGVMSACDPLDKMLLSNDNEDPKTRDIAKNTEPGMWSLLKRKTSGSDDSAMVKKSRNKPQRLTLQPTMADDTLFSLQRSSEQWRAIVEQYSSLSLSRQTDRLPALSGLAIRASTVFGQYLCGLWAVTLHRDLLWKVPLLVFGNGRPPQYTGPSWSWASVNGAINYWHDLNDESDREEEAARLFNDSLTLDTWYERDEALGAYRAQAKRQSLIQSQAKQLRLTPSVKVRGENSFGEVTEGRLRVTGHMQEATLSYVYHREGQPPTISHDPLQFMLEVSSVALSLPFFADYILSEGPHKIPEKSALWLLLMHPNICLVLRKRDFWGTYERIGIVRQPTAYLARYDLNWMSGSSLKTITIT